MGGHGPVLVFDDCDLDKTLDILVTHKFRNAGQVCVAPTRFHVQEGIYERFAKGFAERAAALKIGDGLSSDTQMGPMANPRRPEAIGAMIEDAVRNGARKLTGGEAKGGDGFFFSPTVLADVSLDAKAMNEEPFGPIALIPPFATTEDAIAEANRLPFGLGAYASPRMAAARTSCRRDRGGHGRDQHRPAQLGRCALRRGQGKRLWFGRRPEGIANHMITKAVHIA